MYEVHWLIVAKDATVALCQDCFRESFRKLNGNEGTQSQEGEEEKGSLFNFEKFFGAHSTR